MKPDGNFGRNACDRVAARLGGKGGRTRNARIDFDKEILKRSRTLREYSMFIYFVNECLDREMSLEEAVAASVKRAKNEGILVDFLNKYATELTI